MCLQEERLTSTFLDRGNWTHIFVADQPPLLYTCHESRQEALRWYRRSFNKSRLAKNGVYFNPQIDTLYISKHSTCHQRNYFIQQNSRHMRSVKYLAIPREQFTITFMTWNPIFAADMVSHHLHYAVCFFPLPIEPHTVTHTYFSPVAQY
jgi:hypothetical protein